MSNVSDKVRLIQFMGDDLAPVNAARVSMHKHSNSLSAADKRLLTYLARNGHWTPLGHTAVTIAFKMPIYVARQWMKSAVGFVINEVSRRYVDEDPEYQTEVLWRNRPDKSIKQGSGDTAPYDVQKAANQIHMRVLEVTDWAYKEYLGLGIAPEQARIDLPLNTYTEFWQTGNLESFGRLCSLRLDPHAQQETREYAQAVSDIMAGLFPNAWAARMRNYRQERIDELEAELAALKKQLLEELRGAV